MMIKEEQNTITEEMEVLTEKTAELTDEEIAAVTGGETTPEEEGTLPNENDTTHGPTKR